MLSETHIPDKLFHTLLPITLICGHYGVGKTNFALNLAQDAHERMDVRMIDLDIVNPYFRTSEYANVLEACGIEITGPVMANSSLDSPSLSAEVDGAISWAMSKSAQPKMALFDVGGDDVGATALGRYAQHIKENANYSLMYVINAYRAQTQSVSAAIEILREIEHACKLQVTGIVNNSHVRTDTTVDDILEAEEFGLECASRTKIPLIAQTVPEHLLLEVVQESKNLADINYYPVKMLVKTPWEST